MSRDGSQTPILDRFALNYCGVQNAEDVRYKDISEVVVEEERKKLRQAKLDVYNFLVKNRFEECDPNEEKGQFFVTYPLHEAVKQNNAYITWNLLIFGANPQIRDTWGYSAYSYAKHPKVRDVFKRLGVSPTSPKWQSASWLCRHPPPPGWEHFFAKLSQDPLVKVENREVEWFQELGERNVRLWGQRQWPNVGPSDLWSLKFWSLIT